MADNSSIEWTQATWNPVTGCTKISQGCKHCYAERMAKRLQAMGKSQYRNGFKLTLQPSMLNVPRKWKRPRVIFVNSMSDLFHKDVPLAYIKRVFKVMNECPQHTFQVLTKRPEIAASYSDALTWSDNIWMGTSVENMLVTHRIASLREVPAKVRFLSVEPLIGPFKQWGGVNKKAAGRELDGRTWDELPFGIRTVEIKESDERQPADCVGC